MQNHWNVFVQWSTITKKYLGRKIDDDRFILFEHGLRNKRRQDTDPWISVWTVEDHSWYLWQHVRLGRVASALIETVICDHAMPELSSVSTKTMSRELSYVNQAFNVPVHASLRVALRACGARIFCLEKTSVEFLHRVLVVRSSCHLSTEARVLWSPRRTELSPVVAMPSGTDRHAIHRDVWTGRLNHCQWQRSEHDLTSGLSHSSWLPHQFHRSRREK